MDLWDEGLQLVTKIKSNMKNKLMHLVDRILLRKRAIIESVNDQLKNISSPVCVSIPIRTVVFQ